MFRQLTHCVTQDSLQLILNVLEPKQTKDDIMEVEGEGTVPSDQDTDHSSDEESEKSEDSSIESEEGGDSSVVSEEGGEEVDPIFRADVRKALGAAGLDSDSEVRFVCEMCDLCDLCVCRVEGQWMMMS